MQKTGCDTAKNDSHKEQSTPLGWGGVDRRRYSRDITLLNVRVQTCDAPLTTPAPLPSPPGHRSTAPRVRVEDGRARGEHELRVGWRQERGLCFLLTFFSNILFFANFERPVLGGGGGRPDYLQELKVPEGYEKMIEYSNI